MMGSSKSWNVSLSRFKIKQEAEALSISAAAEAEANKQIAASLTNNLVDKIKYEKWDGKMPTVSGSNAIVSIDGMTH